MMKLKFVAAAFAAIFLAWIAHAEEIIKVDGSTGEATVEQKDVQKKRRANVLTTSRLNTRLTKSSVIRTNGEGTDNVVISSRFPNRIATPFARPRVIGNTRAEIVKDGSNIFLSVPKKAPTEPFTIFVTGSNAGDPVISLTLIPKDIPAQVVALQVDSAKWDSRKNKPANYTQSIVNLLREVAIGKVPEGFSEGVMPSSVGHDRKHGLFIIPVSRFSGTTMDIYKYKVENNYKTIELSETSFYKRGVRAVSIYPNIVLTKGESTNVYVLADKSFLDVDK